MRAPSSILVAALAGCSFNATGEAPPAIDAAPSQHDGPDGCASFSAQLDTCTVPGLAAPADLVLSGNLTFDTGTGALHDDDNNTGVTVDTYPVTLGGQPAIAILAHDITLVAGTHVRATGSFALAIVASGKITFGAGALIDASDGGAGARAVTACALPPQSGQSASGGGGGGGGGGYGAAGGKGGSGNSDTSGGNGATVGGMGGGLEATAHGPLGGCPGAPGGKGSDNGGAGGNGGGAIDLVAATSIDLGAGGVLDVGGGAGKGGTQSGLDYGDAGGGGGGTGGTIVLEAARVAGTGILAANGGSGGQGSGDYKSGSDGATGTRTSDPAQCGKSKSSGTVGADGGAAATMVGASVGDDTDGGGGGGGGSVGMIHVMSASVTLATASPAPTP